jgi:histidyl-tRNA synthetase
MKGRSIKLVSRAKAKVFFIHVGDLAKKKTFALIEQFIEAGIPVIESLGRESLKAQLRVADKAGASLALIFGQKEAFEETIIIRDLKSGNQESIPLSKLIAEVKKRLK